jgi:hypothetical protein
VDAGTRSNGAIEASLRAAADLRRNPASRGWRRKAGA